MEYNRALALLCCCARRFLFLTIRAVAYLSSFFSRRRTHFAYLFLYTRDVANFDFSVAAERYLHAVAGDGDGRGCQQQHFLHLVRARRSACSHSCRVMQPGSHHAAPAISIANWCITHHRSLQGVAQTKRFRHPHWQAARPLQGHVLHRPRDQGGDFLLHLHVHGLFLRRGHPRVAVGDRVVRVGVRATPELPRVREAGYRRRVLWCALREDDPVGARLPLQRHEGPAGACVRVN